MRTLTFTKVAVQAELMIIRRQATAVARRAVFALVAAVFGMGVLVLLHIIGYMALRQFAHIAPIYAALILLGVDLVFLAVFAMLASGEVADPVIEEARLVRDQSLMQVRESLTLAALIRPAGRFLGRGHIFRVLLAALTSRFLGKKAR
jgi:hypothetical protein